MHDEYRELEQSVTASLEEARKKAYGKLAEELKPKSPVLKNVFFAFLWGGGICAFGEILYLLLGFTSLTEKNCITVTLLLLIIAGAVLTALGLYDKLGKIAGAGSIVPISGFANSIAAPALEWKNEGWINGLAAKLFTVSGPVIAYGITVSALLGLVKYLWQLLF